MGTKRTTPAQAAADEVADADVDITLRGETFTLKGATRRSFAVSMAIADNNAMQLIYELIQPEDRGRLLQLGRGVSFDEIAREFFNAYD